MTRILDIREENRLEYINNIGRIKVKFAIVNNAEIISAEFYATYNDLRFYEIDSVPSFFKSRTFSACYRFKNIILKGNMHERLLIYIINSPEDIIIDNIKFQLSYYLKGTEKELKLFHDDKPVSIYPLQKGTTGKIIEINFPRSYIEDVKLNNLGMILWNEIL